MPPLASFALRMLRVLSLYTLLDLVSCQQSFTATPFAPPAVPLAVVHPYLSSWLLNGSNAVNNDWPKFSTKGYITGWAGYVRVDGQAFRFLGASLGGEVANQTGLTFTPTRSTFTFTAGPVTLTAEFLTPIEPDSLVNQSMPFSYLSVSAKSDQPHHVQIYSDISAEWLAGDPTLQALWNIDMTDSFYVHEISLQKTMNFSETGDRAHFYSSYYATKQGNGVTYQIGQDTVVRGQFVNNGVLSNSVDNNFRAINDRFPVFGFSVDLGQTSDTTSNPVVFAVGLAPDSDAGAVQYVTPSKALEDRYLFFLSEMSVLDGLHTFLGDYPNAKQRADAFDAKVSNDASKFSTEYSDLLSLATRQVFGAIQITCSRDSSGSYNQSDVLTFMKEISSAGLINTIDVIYPSMPIFLYTNPTILQSLLEPTLRYMGSGLYGEAFVPHDLGLYPVASGVKATTPNQPVEESANMLIMALAAARTSGDGTQLQNHLQTLQGAADYLVFNALAPGNQASTDDFLGMQPNTSNLALKGIIALSAMQEIQTALNITGNTTYSDAATSYINQWTQLAVLNGTGQQSPHVLSEYGSTSSYAMPYNLYADQLLGTKLVPSFVYQVTEEYVQNPTFGSTFGVTLDSRQPTNSKTDWTLFTAAALNAQNTTVRDQLVHLVHAFAAAKTGSNPFPDYYNITNAGGFDFQARPVQGAMFSLLTLNLPTKPITLQPSPNSPPSPPSPSSPSSSQPGQPGGKGSAASIQILNLSWAFIAGVVIVLTSF